MTAVATLPQFPLGLKVGGVLKRKVSAPIDLGEYNPEYAGLQVIFNLRMPMSLQDQLQVMQDPEATSFQRSDAAKEWLRVTIAAWNIGIEQPDGSISYLAQPYEGGLEDFPLDADLLAAIAQAFGAVFMPKQD